MMKNCVVCGHAVNDGGSCPVQEGYQGQRVFVVCDAPLCEFCEHGHGKPDSTHRTEFAGIEPKTSEWRQAVAYNIAEDEGV